MRIDWLSGREGWDQTEGSKADQISARNSNSNINRIAFALGLMTSGDC